MRPRTFAPSRDGWPFSNGSLVGTPLRVGRVRVGRVIGGLCGGMCLAALRHWRDGDPLPTDPRAAQTEIAAAQLRSFDVPRSPGRYLRLQRPRATDARQQTTAPALAAVRAELSAGEPVLLGLVCVLSRAPWAATEHHVVLAYDLIAEQDQTQVRIYDPNYPARDDVTLQVSDDGARLTHSRGRRVYAMFPIEIRH
ncbi:hypothetical protein EK0264_17860 [Epidermidibacterium keratini]|uniref:Peptidase C39-like domain-containing protein n=1 Tax=Epidermidibacterium keratini TaxID=1891644 RepID=A0A7L4YS17_9ACTN|nr:hypothetical protein [Epidermidibacterium keratini]QHC01956.1 hypothetical protein EK0264_17860 [Epidermidibacterium keratini]